MMPFEGKACIQQFHRIIHDTKTPLCTNERRRQIVRQRVGPRRPRRLHIEFLQNLNGEDSMTLVKQGAGNLCLACILLPRADGVQQDIGVEENHRR